MEYKGTLIIVTHDREFLDNVVSSILVFEDSGTIFKTTPVVLAIGIDTVNILAEMDNPISAKDKKNKPMMPILTKASGNKKLSYKLKRETGNVTRKDRCNTRKRLQLLEEQTRGKMTFIAKPYPEQQPDA